MKKVPVNIISGFLGSGKTTAIIRLLSQKNQDESWAIVVNEFGKVSVDGLSFQPESTTGSVFDIPGGCICCSARHYLEENLRKIIDTGNFNRIIIEPSGLGGIEMVSGIAASIPGTEVMPVICMVDITSFENPKLFHNLIFKAQITQSDRIVFSRCDLLVSGHSLQERLSRFKSLFPLKHSVYAGATPSPELLMPFSAESFEYQGIHEEFFPVSNLNDAAYCGHVLQATADFLVCNENLKKLLESESSILRAKGHIRTKNGWMILNYTLSVMNMEACNARTENMLVIIAEKSSFDFSKFEKQFFHSLDFFT